MDILRHMTAVGLVLITCVITFTIAAVYILASEN